MKLGHLTWNKAPRNLENFVNKTFNFTTFEYFPLSFFLGYAKFWTDNNARTYLVR